MANLARNRPSEPVAALPFPPVPRRVARHAGLAVLLALIFAHALAAQGPATPAAAKIPAPARMPRTADGHPDLQGIWTNATITPLERPPAFAGKPAATEAEATAFEKR